MNDASTQAEELAPKRQERGRRRMEEILRAAARVFAEEGYEKATTNAIAAEAGISPGSLYQFFKNKDDIAAALAAQYVEQLQAARSSAFDSLGDLPVDEAVSLVIDPLVAFNVANPGFKALFARTDMPSGLRNAVAPIHEAIHRSVGVTVATLIPSLPEADVDRTVTVLVHIVRGMMPPVVAAEEGEARDELVGELKAVLVSYLTSIGAE